MSFDQGAVFGVMLLTLAFFLWGYFRYDLVAVLALLALTLLGIVPMEEAFVGFGHPAVITVAAVLILSRSLQNAGAVDLLARWLARAGDSPVLQVPVLSGTVALMSGFMNNVGALALLMPVTIRMAQRSGGSPGALLMPLAFGSLLGGLVTLIGTPPNIIVSSFRAESGGDAFRMFDFTPVGLAIALAGLAFVSLVGWRLIPHRRAAAGGFDIAEYVAEVRIPESSALVGETLRQVEERSDAPFSTLGLVRSDGRHLTPSGYEMLLPEDVLLVKADHDALQALLDQGMELAGSSGEGEAAETVVKEERFGPLALAEAVVGFGSVLVGRTAVDLRLRRRYGVSLLAVSRAGQSFYERLNRIRLQPGDVILLQAPEEELAGTLGRLGCLPLADRGLRLGMPRRAGLTVAIFAAAIAAAAVGLVEVQVAFICAAAGMILLNVLSLDELYASIDWPVIVLLGAMIPVAGALQATGAADLVAERILDVVPTSPEWVALTVVLVGTMFLSDLVNNAASALVMAPIALRISDQVGASSDMFLMAVAIGASSAFLTPIGHQSNTLVMGPGGYHFGDYARMGLPLEAIIVLVAVPMLLLVW